jgi:lipopolysaccharide export system protein LptC
MAGTTVPHMADLPDPRAPQRGDRLARFLPGTGARRRYSAFYSHFVSLLKFLLPAAALTLAGLLLLWPQINPVPVKIGFKTGVSVEDLENLRMLAPRMIGRDSKEQPYTVTAEQATQAAGSSDVTDLIRPKGDIQLDSGAWVALTANTGKYNKQSQMLHLEGNVNVFHDSGYELQTTTADVDLDKGNAQGDDPVVGQGPDSELQGEGFRLYNKGAQIIVTGKSRLVIHNMSRKKAE